MKWGGFLISIPNAIRRRRKLLKPVNFNLNMLKYEYPEEITTGGKNNPGRTYKTGLGGCAQPIMVINS